MNRPCLGCGTLIGSGSRCPDCRLPTRRRTPQRRTIARTATDWRWRKLSQRLRKQSPSCELCGATGDLTAGHIIPVSEAPELAYDLCNLRVECRPCGSRRGTDCTDAERHAVMAAIGARTERTQAYYAARASSR